MAKFIFDDEGKVIMSTDKFLKLYGKGEIAVNGESVKQTDQTKKKPLTKINIPGGRLNSFKLNGLCLGDLLKQIQNNWNAKCIICAIKGETHECPYHTETVTKKISSIIGDKIDNKVRNMSPKKKDETDEEYEERLLYWYMEMFYPSKLKEIKCTECLNEWLNSEIW